MRVPWKRPCILPEKRRSKGMLYSSPRPVPVLICSRILKTAEGSLRRSYGNFLPFSKLYPERPAAPCIGHVSYRDRPDHDLQRQRHHCPEELWRLLLFPEEAGPVDGARNPRDARGLQSGYGYLEKTPPSPDDRLLRVSHLCINPRRRFCDQQRPAMVQARPCLLPALRTGK